MAKIGIIAPLSAVLGQSQAGVNLKACKIKAIMKRKVSNCAGVLSDQGKAENVLRLLFVQRSYPETSNSEFKKFTVKKFRQFLKALTVKLSIFNNKRTSHPEILRKVYR